MKIACLLGVAKYSHYNDLPACINDLQLMNTLLDLTGEFEEILKVDGNQSSSKIKQQIVSFLTRYKGKEIEQVLFYFSGHGDFDGNEFYYVLSDFEASKKKQTVIENSELDSWLRLINPTLAVKIVDACHAGVQYIKDPDVFTKSLNKTAESFQSCYFLFSSQKDQYSYQDNSLSDFTNSLLKSVAEFQGTEIRFKDIIDFISDEFVSNANQTPFFVTQATNTEIFCQINDPLKYRLTAELHKCITTSHSGSGKSDIAIALPTSLVERVKAEALNYCTKEEVLSSISQVHKYWEDCTYPDDMSALYEFTYQSLPSLESEVPKLQSIGKWLSENENNYFALPTSREQEYEDEIEVPVKRSGLAAAALVLSGSLYGQEYEIKKVVRTRKIITGFRLTQDIDNPAIKITACPKFENLNWYDCHLTFVFSKTQIRFFYLFSTFRESNWEQRSRQPEETWRMLTADFKSAGGIDAALHKILEAFTDYIMSPVRVRFGSQDTIPKEIEGSKT